MSLRTMAVRNDWGRPARRPPATSANGSVVIRRSKWRLRRVGRAIDCWWWRPSPQRALLGIPVAVIAVSVSGRSAGEAYTVRSGICAVVAVTAMAPLLFTGSRLIAHALFIDPARAWLIRRSASRSGYGADGRRLERRRNPPN